MRRRCVSFSPARGASGRRVSSPTVALGSIPQPNWTATARARPATEARPSADQAPTTLPPPPSPPPPSRRRFSQLDAVLHSMRAVVDSVSESCGKSMPVVRPVDTAAPAFFRRRSASAAGLPRGAVPGHTSMTPTRRLAATGGSPTFRGAQMHARQHGARVSATCVPSDGALPHASDAAGELPPRVCVAVRRSSRCSAGCVHDPRAASPVKQQEKQQRRRARSASLSAPAQRLDTNARLALLMAALPVLGVEGALASATAPSGADVFSDAPRTRWAGTLRSYAWRKVCDRCAGRGDVIGVGRALLRPAAADLLLAQSGGCAAQAGEADDGGSVATPCCRSCGAQLGTLAGDDNTPEPSLVPPACAPQGSQTAWRPPRRAHTQGSDEEGAAVGPRVGLVAALRSMSAERSRVRQQQLQQQQQPLSPEPESGSASQPLLLPASDGEAVRAAADVPSAVVASAPVTATELPSPDASAPLPLAVIAVDAAPPVPADVAKPVENPVASAAADASSAPIDESLPAPVAPASTTAAPAPASASAEQSRALAEESVIGPRLSEPDSDDSSGASFAREVARAATAAVKRSILERRPSRDRSHGHRRHSHSPLSPSRDREHSELPASSASSSMSSSVQEAVLLAIKSRLRALRLASGGSIDLAGVRDRVLDSLYKQQLAAEERRGRRAAHARDQERLAAQMAARFVGERIRAESVDRRNERLHESDDRTRRTPLGSAGSEDSSSEDRADRRRRARDLSTPRRTCAAAESPRDVRREERGRRVSPRRAGSRGKRGAASQARASDFDDDDRRPARPRSRGGGDRRGWEESDTGESADVTRERRQAQRHDAEFTNSDSSSGPRFGGTVETAGDGRQTRGRRRHGGASRSPLSPTTERRAAHDAAQGRRSAQASARASVASASTTGSLFLSGPSTNFSHPRTPLFHNVEHVLHARREMVSGVTPGSARNASVFSSTEGVSGPELLASRARTLGFVAGNMFGASSTNDTGGDSRFASLHRAATAPDLGTAAGPAGGGAPGLSYIGSLGASIPRHELYTPAADRASYASSSASEKSARQFRAGLGIAAGAGNAQPSRVPAHVPFPQGLLLPTTSAAPHISLRTLADREQDVMGRWSATMAAAAEMQLRAKHHACGRGE